MMKYFEDIADRLGVLKIKYWQKEMKWKRRKQMAKEIVDIRKEEIINACEKLYENNNFKDITIKRIGEETTFSRTSIYNYFQTKEEIFLALFKREYERWIEDLNQMYEENSTMSKEIFADKLAQSVAKRKNLLKLLSMNMYDMEENSRMEELIKFKKAYGNAIKMVRKCVDKFFEEMSNNEKEEFVFLFFPLMYGIYPYAEVTEKQQKAMEKADVPFKYLSIYEITYKGILKLLS